MEILEAFDLTGSYRADPEPTPEPRPAGIRLRTEVRGAGVRPRHPVLRKAVGCTATHNFSSNMTGTVEVVVLVRVLGASAPRGRVRVRPGCPRRRDVRPGPGSGGAGPRPRLRRSGGATPPAQPDRRRHALTDDDSVRSSRDNPSGGPMGHRQGRIGEVGVVGDAGASRSASPSIAPTEVWLSCNGSRLGGATELA